MTSVLQLHGPGSGAKISPDGLYRYRLWRQWDSSLRSLLWVMLNPSTADAHLNDPTVRRCTGFSRGWGFGGIEVVNLFAFRATNPGELATAADSVGPENDYVIRKSASVAPSIMVAWGAQAERYQDRVAFVWKVISYYCTEVSCLGVTKDCHPRHPLMMRRDTERVAWRPHA